MLNEFPVQCRKADARKALCRVGLLGKSYATTINEQPTCN